jgi:DNA-binding LacI/PurR family transcriptional regulator
MKNKLPTMYDVAKLAGVSQPTVSRVLNQNDTSVPISDETRQRVLAAVEQLGYRPNVVARSLRTQRTQTVALLIADLSNGFYQLLARAVQDVARQHDYEVLISNSDHLYENEKHFCEIVLRRGVDGVIMAPQHLSISELNQFFLQTQIPFVMLGRHIDHPNFDVVFVDDERAIYEATTWLIQNGGHQKLGFIGVPAALPPGLGRQHGFTRAVQDAGLMLDPSSVIVDGDFTLEGGKRAARKLIENGDLPSALVVINDLMAIGLILTLQEAGYRVPEDVAVLGFDDIPEATIVRPALTTIAQYPREIGRKLAEALFSRLESGDVANRRVLESSYKLIVRDSA